MAKVTRGGSYVAEVTWQKSRGKSHVAEVTWLTSHAQRILTALFVTVPQEKRFIKGDRGIYIIQYAFRLDRQRNFKVFNDVILMF